MIVALVLWLIMQWTDTGKAIRAIAKEKLGAELSGIDVAHIYAVTFGLGTGCLAIAACLLIPTYYVNPSAGNAFVLIAFTVVVLAAWLVLGALIGGFFLACGEPVQLYLGESSPDRHLCHVHSRSAVSPEWPLRRAGMRGSCIWCRDRRSRVVPLLTSSTSSSTFWWWRF